MSILRDCPWRYFARSSKKIASSRVLDEANRANGPNHTASDSRKSDTEFALEQLVHGLWIGLAAGRLHRLPDEPADHRRLGFRLLDLIGIGGDHRIGDLRKRARPRPDEIDVCHCRTVFLVFRRAS